MSLQACRLPCSKNDMWAQAIVAPCGLPSPRGSSHISLAKLEAPELEPVAGGSTADESRGRAWLDETVCARRDPPGPRLPAPSRPRLLPPAPLPPRRPLLPPPPLPGYSAARRGACSHFARRSARAAGGWGSRERRRASRGGRGSGRFSLRGWT